MKKAGPSVVAQACPACQHLRQRRSRQLLEAWEARHESLVVGADDLHSSLLEHDLGDQDAIGVEGPPPGKIPSLTVVPREQSLAVTARALLVRPGTGSIRFPRQTAEWGSHADGSYRDRPAARSAQKTKPAANFAAGSKEGGSVSFWRALGSTPVKRGIRRIYLMESPHY